VTVALPNTNNFRIIEYILFYLFFLRYPNLNIRSVTPIQVRSLLDTDDPENIKQPAIQSEIDIPKKRRRRGELLKIINLLKIIIYIFWNIEILDSYKIAILNFFCYILKLQITT